jgi:hypothetical protein
MLVTVGASAERNWPSAIHSPEEFSIEPQQDTEWCWAAAIANILQQRMASAPTQFQVVVQGELIDVAMKSASTLGAARVLSAHGLPASAVPRPLSPEALAQSVSGGGAVLAYRPGKKPVLVLEARGEGKYLVFYSRDAVLLEISEQELRSDWRQSVVVAPADPAIVGRQLNLTADIPHAARVLRSFGVSAVRRRLSDREIYAVLAGGGKILAQIHLNAFSSHSAVLQALGPNGTIIASDPIDGSTTLQTPQSLRYTWGMDDEIVIP